MNKFNKGDKVRVVKSGYGCSEEYLNMIVKITEVLKFTEYSYRVFPLIGMCKLPSEEFHNMINENTFELVSPKWVSIIRGYINPTPKRKYKFKVGDIVQIKKAGNGFRVEDLNKIVIITELGIPIYSVYNDNGYKVYNLGENPLLSGTEDFKGEISFSKIE